MIVAFRRIGELKPEKEDCVERGLAIFSMRMELMMMTKSGRCSCRSHVQASEKSSITRKTGRQVLQTKHYNPAPSEIVQRYKFFFSYSISAIWRNRVAFVSTAL